MLLSLKFLVGMLLVKEDMTAVTSKTAESSPGSASTLSPSAVTPEKRIKEEDCQESSRLKKRDILATGSPRKRQRAETNRPSSPIPVVSRKKFPPKKETQVISRSKKGVSSSLASSASACNSSGDKGNLTGQQTTERMDRRRRGSGGQDKDDDDESNSNPSRDPSSPGGGGGGGGTSICSTDDTGTSGGPSLAELCLSRSWDRAASRARSHPFEARCWRGSPFAPSKPPTSSASDRQRSNTASVPTSSSPPLALACRYGAPDDTICAIVDAAPDVVQASSLGRGTPLHEAAANPAVGALALRALLRADERTSSSSPQAMRAALVRDADGCVPLHLLVRRTFASPDAADADGALASMMDAIASCPEAVGAPDLREYEETPLVLALKANLYASGFRGDSGDYYTPGFEPPSSESRQDEDLCAAAMERRIHVVVRAMLSHHPAGASLVVASRFSGYTALHSAVFHGRCSDTVRLLLNADALHRATQNCKRTRYRKTSSASQLDHVWNQDDERSSTESFERPAAIRTNNLGETPLHIAAMRGENARTVVMVGTSVPAAIMARDSNGLTPLHWLWIRFVDRLSERFPHCARRVSIDTSEEEAASWDAVASEEAGVDCLEACFDSKKIFPGAKNEFADSSDDNGAQVSSSSSFDIDYFLWSRSVDPPIDFFQMRHVPQDFWQLKRSILAFTAQTLHHFCDGKKNDQSTRFEGNTQETSVRLFWIKAAFLLRAAAFSQISPSTSKGLGNDGNVAVKHSRQCCAESLSSSDDNEILSVASVHEQKLSRIPLVHAACSIPCCPAPILRLCIALHPKQLCTEVDFDSKGGLPLHRVARRVWFRGELPPATSFIGLCTNANAILDNSTHEAENSFYSSLGMDLEDVTMEDSQHNNSSDDYTAVDATTSLASKTIHSEPLIILRHVLGASPSWVASTLDAKGRLPLHCAVEGVAATLMIHRSERKRKRRPSSDDISPSSTATSLTALVPILIEFLLTLIRANPDALERREGRLQLYPFMLASVMTDGLTAKHHDDTNSNQSQEIDLTTEKANEMSMGGKNIEEGDFDDSDAESVSIVFFLLRQNPALVGIGLHQCPVER